MSANTTLPDSSVNGARALGSTNNNPPLPVVYDGSCRFCRRQMDWIRRRDQLGAFELIPSASSDLLERFPALARENLSTGLRIVFPDGRVVQSADAVYEIARRLPYWRRLTWLYRIPGLNWLWRRLYAWIAANRYRFMGRCDDSCAV